MTFTVQPTRRNEEIPAVVCEKGHSWETLPPAHSYEPVVLSHSSKPQSSSAAYCWCILLAVQPSVAAHKHHHIKFHYILLLTNIQQIRLQFVITPLHCCTIFSPCLLLGHNVQWLGIFTVQGIQRYIKIKNLNNSQPEQIYSKWYRTRKDITIRTVCFAPKWSTNYFTLRCQQRVAC